MISFSIDSPPYYDFFKYLIDVVATYICTLLILIHLCKISTIELNRHGWFDGFSSTYKEERWIYKYQDARDNG